MMGHCAAEELKKQAAEEQRQMEQRAAHERQQRQHDDDALFPAIGQPLCGWTPIHFGSTMKNGLIRPCQMIRAE